MSKNLLELRELLQDNLVTYLSEVIGCEYHDTNLDPNIIDNVCQIIVDTFNDKTTLEKAGNENG